MFTYFPQIKLATQIVAGIGVSKIASDIIKNNVVITSTFQAITVKVGGFILGSMIWEQSSNHIDRSIDQTVAWFEKKNNDEETEQ